MSSEMIAIIAVGVSLAVFMWQVLCRLEDRLTAQINHLELRLDGLFGHLIGRGDAAPPRRITALATLRWCGGLFVR